MNHVVWDWNGTLFDDIHLVIDAVNAGVEWLGLEPVTLDLYRTHYTRPVHRFYETIIGRPISEAEWREIDDRFHRAYAEALAGGRLRVEALDALGHVRSAGIPQSLLSMYPHDDLLPLVRHHRIDWYFDRIDGLTDGSGGRKAAYLEAHITRLTEGVDPASVLVIGDTPDDAHAAEHLGARAILVDGGGHHFDDLESVGVPVVSSLVEAVAIGLS